MQNTVFGAFTNKHHAEAALRDLELEGYKPQDISIITKNQEEAREIADNTGADIVEGATAGVSTGAVLGGLAGLLASTVLPGVGAFFVGGPVASALGLTGAAASTVSGAATGALAGGILGALMGFGLSENDARIYERHINEGAVVVAVPTPVGEEERVEAILEHHRALDVKRVDMVSDESADTVEEYEYMDEIHEAESSQPIFQPSRRLAYATVGRKGGQAGESETKSRRKNTTKTGKKMSGSKGGRAEKRIARKSHGHHLLHQ